MLEFIAEIGCYLIIFLACGGIKNFRKPDKRYLPESGRYEKGRKPETKTEDMKKAEN